MLRGVMSDLEVIILLFQSGSQRLFVSAVLVTLTTAIRTAAILSHCPLLFDAEVWYLLRYSPCLIRMCASMAAGSCSVAVREYSHCQYLHRAVDTFAQACNLTA
jgi:hypothetical protein